MSLPRVVRVFVAFSCVLFAACAADGDPGGGSGRTCTTSGECPVGESCVDGACTTGGPACSGDGECGAGQSCEGGRCVPMGTTTCDVDSDCMRGQRCSATLRCIPAESCLDDRDCADTSTFCSASARCIPNGSCASPDDCPDGMTCGAEAACVPGGECGATELLAEPVEPNLLITLDRSCSMRRAVAGTPKWTSAVNAINALTTRFAGQIRWGLTLFPDRGDGANCRQNAPVPVPIAAGTEMAIQDLLTAALMTSDPNYPDGPCVTNIDTAMEQAAAQPELADPDRRSFVMLITDGRQAGCNAAGGDAGTEMIITTLAGAGVPTYVVGFGGEVDGAQLDMFAMAGGTARMGMPAYYQADDAAMLEAALGEIVASLVSCDFALDMTPMDASMIHVWLNDTEEVARDSTHMDGWDYDAGTNTVTLYGEPCEKLRRGEVSDIDIVFGCPGPVIE